MSKRSNACDISQKVKQRVFERDGGCCVLCGNRINVLPNAHLIRRSQGGLGIEENILSLCGNFTQNMCHYKFDNGTKIEKEVMKAKLVDYLKSKYPNWNEKDLYYKKGE